MTTTLEPCGFSTEDVIVYKNEHQPNQPYVVLRAGHSVEGPGAERGAVEEHAYYVQLTLWALENLDWSGINLYVFNRLHGGNGHEDDPGYSWRKFREECYLVDKLGGSRCLDIQLHLNSAGRHAHGTLTACTRGCSKGLRLASMLQRNVTRAIGTVNNTFSADGLVFNPDPDLPRVDLTRVTQGPSVLLEAAFITNDDDFIIISKSGIKLITAVHDSIVEYFG